MSSKIVDRGTEYLATVGPLTVTYLSGKDASEQDPVFDMSVGEVVLHNSGDKAVQLEYDTEGTFFAGHRYEFGPKGEGSFQHPHIHRYDMADDMVKYALAPGGDLTISREDLMGLVSRAGISALLDGTITTHYQASISVDGTTRSLDFGPHRFHISMKRDWQDEGKEFLKFYADRDGV